MTDSVKKIVAEMTRALAWARPGSGVSALSVTDWAVRLAGLETPASRVETAAKAMAKHSGWEKWDTATSVNDTLNGNEPDEEREHFRDLARIALNVSTADTK